MLQEGDEDKLVVSYILKLLEKVKREVSTDLFEQVASSGARS